MTRTNNNGPIGIAAIVAICCALATGTALAQGSVTTEKQTVTGQPQPQQQPQPTGEAQPAQPSAVQAAPATPTKSKSVHMEQHSENYMLTVAKSTFFGAVAGALVGGAIWIIDSDSPARYVGYWTAGGALVGAGAGIVQVAVNESRTEEALSYNEAPRKSGGSAAAPVVGLRLWQVRF